MFASIAGVHRRAGWPGTARDACARTASCRCRSRSLMWVLTSCVAIARLREEDQRDLRRARHPADGRHGGLHLRGPDVQLPGRSAGRPATSSAASSPRSCSGPWAGTLVMAAVIAVQGLVFQDGGLVVMGANIFNMGVVGTMGGYAVYRALCGGLRRRARGHASPRPGSPRGCRSWPGRALHGARAGHLRDDRRSSSPWRRWLGIHVLIGIGEALVTMAALAFIQVTRPDLLELRDARIGSAAPA